MKTMKLTEFEDDVRLALERMLDEGGIVLEDESGRLRGQVTPFRQASPEARAQARETLARIQGETRRNMEADGRTEEELDAILQEDE